jgi:hypothetical protein
MIRRDFLGLVVGDRGQRCLRFRLLVLRIPEAHDISQVERVRTRLAGNQPEDVATAIADDREIGDRFGLDGFQEQQVSGLVRGNLPAEAIADRDRLDFLAFAELDHLLEAVGPANLHDLARIVGDASDAWVLGAGTRQRLGDRHRGQQATQ